MLQHGEMYTRPAGKPQRGQNRPENGIYCSLDNMREMHECILRPLARPLTRFLFVRIKTTQAVLQRRKTRFQTFS